MHQVRTLCTGLQELGWYELCLLIGVRAFGEELDRWERGLLKGKQRWIAGLVGLRTALLRGGRKVLMREDGEMGCFVKLRSTECTCNSR